MYLIAKHVDLFFPVGILTIPAPRNTEHSLETESIALGISRTSQSRHKAFRWKTLTEQKYAFAKGCNINSVYNAISRLGITS
jgi:hypothetical protein